MSSFLAARLPPEVSLPETVQFMNKHKIQFLVSTRIDQLKDYLDGLDYEEQLKSANTAVLYDSMIDWKPEGLLKPLTSAQFPHPLPGSVSCANLQNYDFQKSTYLGEGHRHHDGILGVGGPPEATTQKTSLPKESDGDLKKTALFKPLSPPFPQLGIPMISSTDGVRRFKEVKEEIEDPSYPTAQNKSLVMEGQEHFENQPMENGLRMTPTATWIPSAFRSDLFPAFRPQSLPMSSTTVPPLFSSFDQAKVKEEPRDDVFGMRSEKPPVEEMGLNAVDIMNDTDGVDIKEEDDEERGMAEEFAAEIVNPQRKPQCDICYKTFAYPSLLKAHYRIHTRDRPFKCDFCHEQFNKSVSLLKHRSTHTGEKPFSCSDCGKRFTTHNGLKGHFQLHSGVKPFSCLECGSQFTTKAIMVQHMRTHTGEMPYKCKECGKTFRQKTSLDSHFRTQHSERREVKK